MSASPAAKTTAPPAKQDRSVAVQSPRSPEGLGDVIAAQ